jgi:hypothetical protein
LVGILFHARRWQYLQPRVSPPNLRWGPKIAGQKIFGPNQISHKNGDNCKAAAVPQDILRPSPYPRAIAAMVPLPQLAETASTNRNILAVSGFALISDRVAHRDALHRVRANRPCGPRVGQRTELSRWSDSHLSRCPDRGIECSAERLMAMKKPSKQRGDRVDQFVERVLLPIIAILLFLGVALFLLTFWWP